MQNEEKGDNHLKENSIFLEIKKPHRF